MKGQQHAQINSQSDEKVFISPVTPTLSIVIIELYGELDFSLDVILDIKTKGLQK